MSDVTRVVFDCNTFLQALAAPDGPAGRCVQLVLEGRIQLFVSPLVIAELREVAARPRVAAKLRLTPERADAFIDAIEVTALRLEGFPEAFVYERDPDDAHYVNLAVAAQVVVSRDKDLLALADESNADERDFRARYPALRFLNPVQFLKEHDVAGGPADGT